MDGALGGEVGWSAAPTRSRRTPQRNGTVDLEEHAHAVDREGAEVVLAARVVVRSEGFIPLRE
jgi:hypothetical protein